MDFETTKLPIEENLKKEIVKYLLPADNTKRQSGEKKNRKQRKNGKGETENE